MKITDYPSVDSLTDGDVILIDGNNGTKKLPVGGNISKMTSSFVSSDNTSETGIITGTGGETAMSAMTSRDTHGGLFGGLSKAVLNTRKLINTVKRIWNSVSATWISGHAYAVNDMVVYENGHVYKCKKAHTSSASILPTNTTYWTDTTLAAEIASLNSNYTKLKWTLLWKNSSPTSNFDAQDFSVPNMSNYSELLVFYSTNWSNGYGSVIVKQSTDITHSLIAIYEDGTHVTAYHRQLTFDFPSTNKIRAGNCRVNFGGGVESRNGWCIPLFIYGRNTF